MSATLPQILLLSLALIMFGLGLSLKVEDFLRLRQHPKAVGLALALQGLVLPALCFALVKGLGLSPVFAVGLMILSASPGGISANLFSHLFGGHVALNISLTAINTLTSIVTLPLISNLAIGHFFNNGTVVPLQFGKVAEVIAVVLIPVAIGMTVAHFRPLLAAKAEKPMKILSALFLFLLAVASMLKERQNLVDAFAEIGVAVLLFNLLSLLAGYASSRWANLDKPFAIAIAYEIGIHNATLALYITLSLLNNSTMALPAALYSVCMYATAVGFGVWVKSRAA